MRSRIFGALLLNLFVFMVFLSLKDIRKNPVKRIIAPVAKTGNNYKPRVDSEKKPEKKIIISKKDYGGLIEDVSAVSSGRSAGKKHENYSTRSTEPDYAYNVPTIKEKTSYGTQGVYYNENVSYKRRNKRPNREVSNVAPSNSLLFSTLISEANNSLIAANSKNDQAAFAPDFFSSNNSIGAEIDPPQKLGGGDLTPPEGAPVGDAFVYLLGLSALYLLYIKGRKTN